MSAGQHRCSSADRAWNMSHGPWTNVAALASPDSVPMATQTGALGEHGGWGELFSIDKGDPAAADEPPERDPLVKSDAGIVLSAGAGHCHLIELADALDDERCCAMLRAGSQTQHRSCHQAGRAGIDVQDDARQVSSRREPETIEMLTFITAVRHPLNSSSYERVSRLLDATLRSVCRQTDDQFRVVVVHNEMPAVTIEDSRIHFVRVTFPAPSPQKTAEIDYNTGIIDKGAKLAIGLAAARVDHPNHVMFIDCDDLVHCEVAAFANARAGHPGWYSPSGYVHTTGTRSVQAMSTGFHRKCGSSAIIRTDLIPVPSDLPQTATKAEVIEAVGFQHLYRLIGTHGKWEEHLTPLGVKVEPLPFPAAVWLIGTGENASGNLVSNRDRVPITEAVTEAFGLEAPSRFTAARRNIEISARRVTRKLRLLISA